MSNTTGFQPFRDSFPEAMSAEEWRDHIQKHHDHYVQLSREGKLSLGDKPQLELALARERAHEVHPLARSRS